MVKEMRMVFEVKDIVGVRYQCLKPTCKGEILYRLDGGRSLKGCCPICGEEWVPDRRSGDRIDPRSYLLTVLQDIRQEQGNARFRARLEMDCEEKIEV